MNRKAQASLEYIMMFAVGMLIAAIVILRLIGVKGLARWAGSQMDTTGAEIGGELQNLSNSTK
ncbi:class III signal peptide-containing protein [Thermococcus sp. M36]|uniref:hypothetical protein n=1 Tax=Thermococcus sp. M36 TaxID=1638261 RepID=UPI00143922EB|nr:hypothetical protein [Thermococcus sp. M36]NJE06192.1 class III signal peptide-containing protein [Thermococcus sp. M36]